MNKFTKTVLFLILAALFFVFEPSLRSKLTYAVTYFNSPKVNYEQNFNDQIVSEPEKTTGQETTHGHAPEPSTLILMMGGLLGMMVRFVRKSFDRFKRYMDLVLSILGLTITAPILVFSALLIKATSHGPVIYKQKRLGKKGKVFEIYKLRTMVVDAERGTGAVWAKRNDPRVTPVGKILRKTRIDEIPQLFNVIEGDMSIIGPRPERPELVRDLKALILDYEKRLVVKPGITGLAQIFHKYDETIEDVKKKVKYDLLYIKRMCLLTDLRILGQTFVVVFTGKGAN